MAATVHADGRLFVRWRLTSLGLARARAKLDDGEGAPGLRIALWDLDAGAARRMEDHPVDVLAGEATFALPEGGAVFVVAAGVLDGRGGFAPAAHAPRGSTDDPRHEDLMATAPDAARDVEVAVPSSRAVAIEPRRGVASPKPRVPRGAPKPAAVPGGTVAARRRGADRDRDRDREERPDRRRRLGRRERDDRPGSAAARLRDRRGGRGGKR